MTETYQLMSTNRFLKFPIISSPDFYQLVSSWEKIQNKYNNVSGRWHEGTRNLSKMNSKLTRARQPFTIGTEFYGWHCFCVASQCELQGIVGLLPKKDRVTEVFLDSFWLESRVECSTHSRLRRLCGRSWRRGYIGVGGCRRQWLGGRGGLRGGLHAIQGSSTLNGGFHILRWHVSSMDFNNLQIKHDWKHDSGKMHKWIDGQGTAYMCKL